MQTPTKTPDQTDLEALLADPEVVSNWLWDAHPDLAAAVLANLVNESDILRHEFEVDHRMQLAVMARARADVARISHRLALGLEVAP